MNDYPQVIYKTPTLRVVRIGFDHYVIEARSNEDALGECWVWRSPMNETEAQWLRDVIARSLDERHKEATMMSYRDTTFCISPNCTNQCGRKLTKEIREAAREWWGGPGAPIALGHFCDDEAKAAKVLEEARAARALFERPTDV